MRKKKIFLGKKNKNKINSSASYFFVFPLKKKKKNLRIENYKLFFILYIRSFIFFFCNWQPESFLKRALKNLISSVFEMSDCKNILITRQVEEYKNFFISAILFSHSYKYIFCLFSFFFFFKSPSSITKPLLIDFQKSVVEYLDAFKILKICRHVF